jgi:TonB family protein
VKAKSSPWLFPEGAVFPIISGELHPLKKFARKLLYRGIIFAAVLHLAAFGGWLMARTTKPEPPPAAAVIEIKRISSTAELGVPPSLSAQVDAFAQEAVNVAAAPSFGVPEPVPDFQATTATMATTEQIADALTPVDLDQLRAGGDSIEIDESIFDVRSNSPSEIISVQELPIPINTPDPVYPDLARSQGVEGEVRVRAFITKDGKVSEVVVVDGNWVLHEAAIAAVKKWTFKPALQQHKPVPVWVEIPLEFSLDR